MSHCPNCGAPVQTFGNNGGRYLYQQPAPLDLDLVRLRAVEDFIRILDNRMRHRPALGYARVVREELDTLRRVLHVSSTTAPTG